MIINTSIPYAAAKNKKCIIELKGVDTYPDDEYYYTGYNMEYNYKLSGLYSNLNRIYGYQDINNYIKYDIKDHIKNMVNNIMDNIEYYFNKIHEYYYDKYNLTDEEIYNKIYPEDTEYLFIDDDIIQEEINIRDKFINYKFMDFIEVVNSYYKVPFRSRSINHFKEYYYDEVFYFMDHPDFNILYQYCLYLVNLFDIFYYDDEYKNIVYDELFYDDRLFDYLIYEVGL